MTFSPLRRRLSRQAAHSGSGGLGTFLAVIALLLHLAVPGLTAMPPVAPAAELQALQSILGNYAVEICNHADESTGPSDDPANPVPRHKPGHDCVACCSPASLAAILPLVAAFPLSRGTGVVATAGLASAGPSLSIYAVRQRSPPTPPTA